MLSNRPCATPQGCSGRGHEGDRAVQAGEGSGIQGFRIISALYHPSPLHVNLTSRFADVACRHDVERAIGYRQGDGGEASGDHRVVRTGEGRSGEETPRPRRSCQTRAPPQPAEGRGITYWHLSPMYTLVRVASQSFSASRTDNLLPYFCPCGRHDNIY